MIQTFILEVELSYHPFLLVPEKEISHAAAAAGITEHDTLLSNLS